MALLVLDGLALSQWVLLRQTLHESLPGLRLGEDAVFAWIPTLTVVSRQALFAGRPPFFFARSIQSTSSEAAHWRRFWQDRGLKPFEIGYRRNLESSTLGEAESVLADGRVRALALVVNTVDDIMHGMQLGERGMAHQVRQWASGEFLPGLLDRLLGSGFDVWLTSDHGNVEARGFGAPAEGALASTRGERVRIFSDEALRDAVANRFTDAMPWPPLGLPESFLPLLAPGRAAFVKQGRTVVSHGGAAIEEVIVPLVRIRREPS